MTTPKLFDIVALKTPLPALGLRPAMTGTVVELYESGACEVEFTSPEGETVALTALEPDQMEVVWHMPNEEQADTVEELVLVVKALPPQAAREVLDFAHFLQTRVA